MENSMIQRAEIAAAEFYESTKKNKLFNKNSQKFECAEAVTSKIPITELLEAMAFRISGSKPMIFIRYELFKMIAAPSTFEAISTHVLSLIAAEIASTGTYEFHLDLTSATVSALDRYRSFFEFFVELCEVNNIVISDKATAVVIYNTPGFVMSATPYIQTFVDKRIISIIEYISKVQSAEKLAALFKNY